MRLDVAWVQVLDDLRADGEVEAALRERQPRPFAREEPHLCTALAHDARAVHLARSEDALSQSLLELVVLPGPISGQLAPLEAALATWRPGSVATAPANAARRG